MLDKLGGLETTQTELVGWFSSPQPLITLEGRSSSEGMHCRERTDFFVLGVCGCPRSQAISSVGVLSSSMSSLA